MRAVFLLILAGISFAGGAKEMGTRGDLWPVQEQSFLALIQGRLKTMEKEGELARLQTNFQDRVVAHTLRPTPVAGLRTDTQAHTGWYDPSFVVAQDIADHQGQVFAHKGDVINPLSRVAMNTTLYFIDGDSPEQVAWMKAQTPPTLTWKVILVNGDISQAADRLATRIYFDQNGTLSRQLGLTYIPARVVQDGLKLRIDSFAMKGEAP